MADGKKAWLDIARQLQDASEKQLAVAEGIRVGAGQLARIAASIVVAAKALPDDEPEADAWASTLHDPVVN